MKTKPTHSDGALQTLKFPDELDRIMGKIVADAKLAEQEMGISTLFLSFGFLEWYESDVSDKKAFAPLLLLPVTVDVKKQYGKNTSYGQKIKSIRKSGNYLYPSVASPRVVR